MQPSTLVLLHSPLTGAAAWGGMPGELRNAGFQVIVPEVIQDTEPPFAGRYVAHAALQIAAAEPGPSTVLVAHSGAGPLLPAIGFARRSAHQPVHGYVFLDAGLPRPGAQASRLELMTVEDAEFAAELQAALEAGDRFPDWSSADLTTEVPDDADRALLLASLRPRGLEFFREPLPAPTDWPDAPCGYLHTSAAYDVPARLARGRGWPTVQHTRGHFAALADPVGTALALQAVLDAC